jgi:hypothetical protein
VIAYQRNVPSLRGIAATYGSAFRPLEHVGRSTAFELDMRPIHDGRNDSSS